MIWIGATIPETEEDARKCNNYANQLLSNPHSYNTQNNTAASASYDSSIHRVDTASEGWF